MRNNFHEIKTLTLLKLRDLFGINKFLHTKDKKAKNRYKLLSIVWILLILMAISYVGGQSFGLIFLGLSDLVVPYLVLLASLLIFVFDIFKAGGTIFSKKSYDIICSLPLHTSSIVVARFLGMYVTDLLLSYLILLPGTAVYGILISPSLSFYLMLFLGSLFIPMLPLVLATLIGALINAISSRMKNTSLSQTILMVGFVVVTLVFSFSFGSMAEDITMEMLLVLATQIGDMIASTYPPAMWLQRACLNGDFLSLLLFVGIALVAFGLMITLVAKSFHQICAGLFATTATHNYQMETLKQESVLPSLYKRDLKRYFASSIYVTNTIVGPIMGLMMAAALAFVDTGTILSFLEIPSLPFQIESMVPFFLAGIFTTMTATSVSISMEGEEVWIMQTLPIPVKSLWDSKILVNLSLIAPFFILSEGLLLWGLRPGVIDALWLILIPAVIILFALVFGITINLKLHSFDWENEGYVVKQSASAGLGGFIGMLVSLACGVIFALLPAELKIVGNTAIVIVLAGLTWVLYEKNNRVRLENL